MKSKKSYHLLLIPLCSAALLLVASTTMAMSNKISETKTTYNITSKFYVDGKLISSPQIIALPNQKAMIVMSDNMTTKDNKINVSGNSLKLELVARNVALSQSRDAIRVNYDIQYVNGKENMHSKPQIIVMPKQEGEISFSSKSGHEYKLSVLAVRQ